MRSCLQLIIKFLDEAFTDYTVYSQKLNNHSLIEVEISLASLWK